MYKIKKNLLVYLILAFKITPKKNLQFARGILDRHGRLFTKNSVIFLFFPIVGTSIHFRKNTLYNDDLSYYISKIRMKVLQQH